MIILLFLTIKNDLKVLLADFPNTKFRFPELFSCYTWHVTTSRYLDDILNINKVYFDNMVSQIYPS